MINVKIGVQPPIVYIVAAIANVSERRGIALRITSGIDGKHSRWSGHYQLRCVDVGTKELPESQLSDIRDDIRGSMTVFFPSDRIYVEIHSKGDRGPEGNEHIHAQFK